MGYPVGPLLAALADRILHNLDLIDSLAPKWGSPEQDQPPFSDTQLLMSLLGVLVFPHEKAPGALGEIMKGYKPMDRVLNVINLRHGGGRIEMTGAEGEAVMVDPTRLTNLPKLLRNSLAHFNVLEQLIIRQQRRRTHMASFVLVPGAGGMAWYWHRVVPLIGAAGHEPIAVDLPGDDRHAGLGAYADIVIRAIAERSDVILVAQSLAGFTAPLVCARAPVRMVVFVNAMIPKPSEAAGAWWDATGAAEAREQAAVRRGYATEFDAETYFLHDVPQDVLRAGPEHPREEAETVFGEPCRFECWPEIPIAVLAGRDDRFFPIEFQRRVARERLGKEVEEIPGGHLVALSNPEGLTERLLAYERGLTR
jgi:pimeloyl-ACP methyl ester carboxylesterase